MDIKSLEEELYKLSPREKAVLTYKLLESLENDESEDIDEIWLTEAVSRYYQISDGESEIIDSDLVLKEAKLKYR